MKGNIGERIKYIREKLINIEQDALAKLLKMSRSNVSSIETGRVKPSLQFVLTLSEACDIRPSWILLGNGESPNSLDDNYYNYSVAKTMITQAYNVAEKIIEELPTRIQNVREIRRISQKELAEKINVSQSNISSIENGYSQPTVEIITKITELLRIDIDELLSVDNYDYYVSHLTPQKLSLVKNRSAIAKNSLDIEGITDNQLDIIKNLIIEFRRQNDKK
jgi:transcriptional regulator with XRE-family HTH domain